MDCLPADHAVEERPTFPTGSALNNCWDNQFGAHNPQPQGEEHEEQQQTDATHAQHDMTAMGQYLTGIGVFSGWHHGLPVRA
jgi:hypothetical protein